jgi:purine-binding chemotaxis protein CheW
MSDTAATQLQQFLTFTVGTEEYAIAIARVQEILAFVPLTRVPRAPRFVSGVMNLRGSVIPVVDAAGGAVPMGVLAEEVRQVMELSADEIEPPPSFGTRIDLAFLHGMGDLGDHFALILDIDKVLSTFELITATSLAAEAAEISC